MAWPAYNTCMAFDERHVFTRSQLEQILSKCIGKTLQEVDTQHVLNGKRNKGYAGAIIEQSVLG